jgi:hypothetical protein
MRSDWLPAKREQQIAMAKQWYAILNRNAQKWKIPNEVETELEGLTEAAQDELAEAMSGNRTATITARCNEAFSALVAKMRDIKDRYFKKPPLADPDFISLGLKPKDTVKTPVAAPAGQAEADVTYPGPHLLMLRLRHIEGTLTDDRADYGYRVYYGILPHGGATAEEAAGIHHYLMKPPVSGEELPNSTFPRRKKEIMDLPAEDSGKTAYFCIRYENAKGQKGPWGPLFSAVIP